MAGYMAFGEVYDTLIADVDYNAWATYILKLFDRFGTKPVGSILDLACGTGNLTEQLLQRGYEVVAVDGSDTMLMAATEKCAPFGEKCMLLCQDMRQLDLFGTVDGAVCMLDSINHLTDTADIAAVFSKLGLFIEKDGLLIFDVNTIYKHQEVLGDNTFVYDTEDCFCVWQNRFVKHTNESVMTLDFFVQDGDGYVRYCEDIRERAYAVSTLQKLLKTAGFEVLAVYNEQTFDTPTANAERVVFVAKNTGVYQK